MADFHKDGGAQRPVEQQLPPKVPRPKAAPETAVKPTPYVHPANRKAGQA
jgi:hypothetical protein